MTADITSSGCAFPTHGCSPISPGAPARWPQPRAPGQRSLVLISWNCRLGTISTMPRHWSGWCERVRVMTRRGRAMRSKCLGSKRSLVPNAPHDSKNASALVGLARNGAAGTDIVRFAARCAGGRGRCARHSCKNAARAAGDRRDRLFCWPSALSCATRGHVARCGSWLAWQSRSACFC